MADIHRNQDSAGFKLFGATIPLEIKQVKEEQTMNESSGETSTKRPDKTVPCPRCKSTETKFCYFNNYNVNQPRHFCKGCQRYWTAGGALRNVPVGAGRRKTKLPCDRTIGECLFDGSGMVEFGGFDRVVEQWPSGGGAGGFRHVLQGKRQCTGSAGQIC